MNLELFLYIDRDAVAFPGRLSNYRLTESLLEQLWAQVQSSEHTHLDWSLKGIPNVDFYQDLHHFMRMWPKTRQATKMAVGCFYIAIDANLQVKGCRADNAYRFIQRIAQSNLPRNTLMNYGFEERKVKSLEVEVEKCSQQVQKLTLDCVAMKKELEETRCALKDVTNRQRIAEKQRDKCQKQVTKLQDCYASAVSDCGKLENVVEDVVEENASLSEALTSIQRELSALSNAASITIDTTKMCFCFTTKTGDRMYSPSCHS